MARNEEILAVFCIFLNFFKKDWKKVLTKGDRGGIIVKLSRETAITTEGNELTEKTF